MTTANESICLFCMKLEIKECMLNIFDTHIHQGQEDKLEIYSEMLRICFDVQVEQQLGYSDICLECVMQLRTAFYFRLRILKSLKLLYSNDKRTITGKQNLKQKSDNSKNDKNNKFFMEPLLDPKTGHLRHAFSKWKNKSDQDVILYNIDMKDVETGINIREEATDIPVVETPEEAMIETCEVPIAGTPEVPMVETTEKAQKEPSYENVETKSEKYETEELEDMDQLSVTAEEICGTELISENVMINDEEIAHHPLTGSDDDNVDNSIDEAAHNEEDSLQSAIVSQEKEVFYHYVDKEVICELCADVIPSKRFITQHMKTHHPDSPLAKKLRDIPNLNRNGKKTVFTLEPGQTDCSICDEKFISTKTLKEHMNKHYPNFVCEICKKTFAYREGFRSHMRSHLKGPFPCNFCDKVFSKVASCENHVRRVHTHPNFYVCRECGARFRTLHQRLHHLRLTHGQVERKYACTYCEAKFYSSTGQRKHIRTQHLREHRYKCSCCPSQFTRKNLLRMHMDDVHHTVGKKLFKCTECDETFFFVSNLQSHMKEHREFKVECNYCDRKFKEKQDVIDHIKKDHISKLNISNVDNHSEESNQNYCTETIYITTE